MVSASLNGTGPIHTSELREVKDKGQYFGGRNLPAIAP